MDQDSCDNQILRMGLVEEATIIETENKAYLAYQKYIIDKYKINATYDTYPIDDLVNWTENEELYGELDVFITSLMMNLMVSRIGDKYKAFSFPIQFNPLLMLSKPPRPRSSSTMDFFNVDLYTVFFILLCVILVSAFWSISRCSYLSFKSSTANSKRSILSASLDSLWDSFILFFSEPYTFIPMTLSVRIVTGVWLLSVLILNISLGSVMKASFSFVTYELVDTLKELRNSKKMLPKFLKGAVEERLINLKSLDNEDFRYVRDHVTEDTFLSITDILNPDLYTQLKETEYFFINYHLFLILMGFAFRDQNSDNSIYISQPISEDYMVYPYRFNSSRCHKINTIFEQVVMDLFETQWVKSLYFQDLYLMEKLNCRIPDSETKAIQFHDLLSVDLLFCYGLTLSCVAITIELLTSVMKKPARKLPLRRKRVIVYELPVSVTKKRSPVSILSRKRSRKKLTEEV